MRMTANETRAFVTGSRDDKLAIVQTRFTAVLSRALARGDTQSARALVREVAFLLRQAESCLGDVGDKLDDPEGDDAVNEAAEMAADMRSLLMDLPSWWPDVICAALGDTRAKESLAKRKRRARD